MTLRNLEEIQEKHFIQMANNLAMTCCRRFLRSAALVEMRGSTIDRLRKFTFDEAFDLGPLLLAWQFLCTRYRTERYDPQPSLFRDRRSELEEQWARFVYWELMPVLVRDDALVRNVLRALGGLPYQSPGKAADAVYQHFLEMTLPNDQPPWALEEIIDR